MAPKPPFSPPVIVRVITEVLAAPVATSAASCAAFLGMHGTVEVQGFVVAIGPF